MQEEQCKRRPYTLKARHVRRSPFRTTQRAKWALRAATLQNRPIGFTARSSLKSMGLLPRANGMYCLGEKYRGRFGGKN